MPDVARSACIVVWGSNPNGNFLTLATDIAAAKARGAGLLVVDPRRVGLANKADVWLQVRPGTDGALALGLVQDRKSTRLNSSHSQISYAVFCLKKKKKNRHSDSEYRTRRNDSGKN